jgi:hypothetical protein
MADQTAVNFIYLIILAGAGGFVLNMANLWEDSKKPKDDRVPKDILYFVFFIFWPIAGAGLAWLYSLDGSSLRPLLSFSIGLSAPATIQSMITRAALRSGSPPNAEP